MPRAPRLIVEGGIYHIISRGVKQAVIFRTDADRYDLLNLLGQAQEEFKFILHAYCLMTNHYHLLLQCLDDSLSKAMHFLNSVFCNRFNVRNKLTGHVLQGRFQSILVDRDSYLTTVSRYIHLNPVRAGMVLRPEDYRWSNYRAMITGMPDGLTDPKFTLGYFGWDLDAQRDSYRQYVEDGLSKPEPITDKVLRRMTSWGVRLAPNDLSQMVPLDAQKGVTPVVG